MTQYKNYAIVLLTYNRPEHFAKVVRSVKRARAESKSIGNFIVVMQGNNSQVMNVIEQELPDALFKQVYHPESLSSKQMINANLKLGLDLAFDNLNCDYAVVVEDDIVVAPDFFVFISQVMDKFKNEKCFRGVNGFSAMQLDVMPEFANSLFVRCNYGLGWGWAINRRNYRKVFRAWDGTEDEHWDSLVEPYVRTGFVVNPALSLVKNIGLDGSGHHTGVNLRLELAMEKSFNLRTKFSGAIKETSKKFPWREDCISLSTVRPVAARALFFLWKIAWIVRLVGQSFGGDSSIGPGLLRLHGHFSTFARRITSKWFSSHALPLDS